MLMYRKYAMVKVFIQGSQALEALEAYSEEYHIFPSRAWSADCQGFTVVNRGVLAA